MRLLVDEEILHLARLLTMTSYLTALDDRRGFHRDMELRALNFALEVIASDPARADQFTHARALVAQRAAKRAAEAS